MMERDPQNPQLFAMFVAFSCICARCKSTDTVEISWWSGNALDRRCRQCGHLFRVPYPLETLD